MNRRGNILEKTQNAYQQILVIAAFFRDIKQEGRLKSVVQGLAFRVRNLPALEFYQYLWFKDKRQFLTNIFVNYILPVLFETLPWYFSRRKIGIKLREERNKLHHNLINGKELLLTIVQEYIKLSGLHAALDTLDRTLKNRVALGNKLIVKRMVLEKLLYSEIWALESFKGQDLENRIMSDITQTLNLFNYTVPSILSSAYAFSREATDLYRRRDRIDALAILRPTIVEICSRTFSWVKYQLVDSKTESTLMTNLSKISQLFSNVFEGLTDIQLNNLQPQQLKELDGLIETELNTTEGIFSFANRVWGTFSSRGALDFAIELVVTHRVMKKRGMNHEQYRKMQIDVDHSLHLLRRIYNMCTQAKNIMDQQGRIVSLMTLPSFAAESKDPVKKSVHDFQELKIQNLIFSYAEGLPPALNFEGEITIQPSKTYAIIGQNRSGKSTLVHILCKLYKPQEGTITFNGIPYEDISRNSLRNLISYVSQKPYVFPGTIRENILIGNPSATEEEVIAAAEAAGLFAFDTASQLANPNTLLATAVKGPNIAASASSSSSGAAAASSSLDVSSRLPRKPLFTASNTKTRFSERRLARLAAASAVAASNPLNSSSINAPIIAQPQAAADEVEAPKQSRGFAGALSSLFSSSSASVSFAPSASIIPQSSHPIFALSSASEVPPASASAPSSSPAISSADLLGPPLVAADLSPSSPSPSSVSQPNQLLLRPSSSSIAPSSASIDSPESSSSSSIAPSVVMPPLPSTPPSTSSSSSSSSSSISENSDENKPLFSSSSSSLSSSASPPKSSSSSRILARLQSKRLGGGAAASSAPLASFMAAAASASSASSSPSSPTSQNAPLLSGLSIIQKPLSLSMAIRSPAFLGSKAASSSSASPPPPMLPESQPPIDSQAIIPPLEVTPMSEQEEEIAAIFGDDMISPPSPSSSSFDAAPIPPSTPAPAPFNGNSSSVGSGRPSQEVIEKLLNFQVAARGSNLSGGFAQSVALARVFLRKTAKIMILDESFSAMDSIKRRDIIMPRLRKFVAKHGITLIIISHDIPSIRDVDHIIVLDFGKLVGQGSHDELVKNRVTKYLELLGEISSVPTAIDSPQQAQMQEKEVMSSLDLK